MSERESIIAQLALVTKYSEEYFRKMTEEELRKELERIHGPGEDD